MFCSNACNTLISMFSYCERIDYRLFKEKKFWVSECASHTRVTSHSFSSVKTREHPVADLHLPDFSSSSWIVSRWLPASFWWNLKILTMLCCGGWGGGGQGGIQFYYCWRNGAKVGVGGSVTLEVKLLHLHKLQCYYYCISVNSKSGTVLNL